MKVSTWVIIVLAIVCTGLALGMVITIQAGIINSAEFKARALQAESMIDEMRVAVKQRDMILADIKGKSAFKDWNGIKASLEKYDLLVKVEKESQK